MVEETDEKKVATESIVQKIIPSILCCYRNHITEREVEREGERE